MLVLKQIFFIKTNMFSQFCIYFAYIMQYLLSVERGHLPAEQGERGEPNDNRQGECKGRREWLCRCEDHVLFWLSLSY